MTMIGCQGNTERTALVDRDASVQTKNLFENLKDIAPDALLSVIFINCNDSSQSDSSNMILFDQENLVAWCIIPFDAKNRTPEERIEMLNELGFQRLAYDWRPEHLPDFPREIKLLRQHNIELTAVWMWIDEHILDSIPEEIDFIFDVLSETNSRTTIWAGFSDHFLEDKPDEVKLEAGVQIVRMLNERAKKTGSSVALYNHGGWYGEPENQIRIIKATGSDNIGIVYNFHHGHEHIERFSEMLSDMLPYLWTVNINGMQIGGPKIMTVGEGDREKEMLRELLDSGFDGTIGIIGHTEGKDIRGVLAKNLSGLKIILKQLDKPEL